MSQRALRGETSLEAMREILARWREEGFDVDRLASLLEAGAPEARHAFETAESGIEKLRELMGEFRAIEGEVSGEQRERLRKMLRNPWLAADAENVILEMHVQIERKRKEAQRRKREEERRRGEMAAAMERWRAAGYSVDSLQEALRGDIEAAERAVKEFEAGVERLRACEEELRGLETEGFEEQRRSVEAMLRLPERAQEAEEALMHLRLEIEKRRRAARAQRELERRTREELLEKVRAWRSEGFSISLEDAEIETGDVKDLTRRLREYEGLVTRARGLLEELEQIKEREFEGEAGVVRGLIHNLGRIHTAEERLLRLQLKTQRLKKEREKRAEENRRWRSEVQEKVAELEGKGYDVTRLKEALGRDDESLKKEWVMFRIQLRRLQELEAELRALPREGIEEAVERLVARTREVSVSTIADLEAGIIALRSRIEARREELLRAKEEEKREKQGMVEKLLGWVEEGYRSGLDERIEKLMTLDLREAREEFRRIEGAIERLSALRGELVELQAPGFEPELEVVREMTWDISREGEVERRLRELREKVRAAEEERRRRAEEERARRRELREKLEEWRRLGFNVASLDPLLDGDLEALRREMAVLGLRIQKAQELQGELGAMDTSDFQEEARAVERATLDLDHLGEAEAALERLRQMAAQRLTVKRKRAELQKRLEEWRSQGYDVSKLEGVMGEDIEAVKKEFLVFKIKAQKLKELEEELRSIDTSGFEAEASAIEAMLKQPDRVGEIRDRLSELELNIGKRRAEALRAQEERRKLRDELMSKMTVWLEEGFHIEPLEAALGKGVEEMSAAFRAFEDSVKEARALRRELEALDQPGFSEQVAKVREMLRSLDELKEARKEVSSLRERMERKKKREAELRELEERQRVAMVEQIEAWGQAGHNVEHLEALAGAKIETLRKAVVAFKVRMERARDIERILDHMEAPELREEVERVRSLARSLETLEAAERELEALKLRIKESHQAALRRREEMRREREAYTDQVMGWLTMGYRGQRLEALLDLPFDKLVDECKRVGACIERLRAVEEEVGRMGIDPGSVPILSRLKDIDALPALEEWLRRHRGWAPAGGGGGTEGGPPERTAEGPRVDGDREAGGSLEDQPAAKKEAPLDPEKLRILRRRLEQWKREGHNVSVVEDYLNSGTITAEGVLQRLKALNIQMKQRRGSAPGEGGEGDEEGGQKGGKGAEEESRAQEGPEEGGGSGGPGGEGAGSGGAAAGGAAEAKSGGGGGKGSESTGALDRDRVKGRMTAPEEAGSRAEEGGAASGGAARKIKKMKKVVR